MGKLNRRNFCQCGCSIVIKANKKYVSGHNGRKYPRVILNHHTCECGCGELVASDKRFIYHHRIKKQQVTLERRLCQCNCGDYANPGYRYILGHTNKNKSFTKEHSRNISIALIGKPNKRKGTGKPKSPPQLCACNCGEMTKPGNIYIRGHQSIGTHPTKETLQKLKQRNCHHTEETKQKMRKPKSDNARKNMKEAQNRPEVIKHNAEIQKITHNTLEYKKKQSITSTIIGAKPEVKIKRSKSIKAVWADPEYRRNQLLAIGKGLCKLPNNPETLINLITQEYFTGWQYSGDYSEIINGKNPDFINEETKQIIEMYGDYWHDGEDPTDRAEIFAQGGYETCVIWENELKNLDAVILKLRRFCGVEVLVC